MTSLFVEHLTVIDCAYLDAQRGLVGESWIVDVEMEGDLDAQSMVLDFGEVKRRLKRAIDGGLDHSLLVPTQAPELRLQLTDTDVRLRFVSQHGEIEQLSPPCALSLLAVSRIDAASAAAHLETTLKPILPANVARLSLHLRPEHIEGASYHYVHGLKKHAGQCQRIAHGHRSRLEIHVDGQRRADLEAAQARAWTDIYLGTRENVIAQTSDRIAFAYDAPEGRFELSLPAATVDLLDTDSTVERIAEHLARRVAHAHPGRAVEVRAYEGVMKGARARA
ncbi:6-pyruvoyl trahydropterin synthase family protein [Panacagrimonas sp.]|uniref:6-pyruvoyl trahydropterin synthase family protein n=1 Tax=Panacagrimonas sp. TaxID=2480088 RepID=UPI003B51DB57